MHPISLPSASPTSLICSRRVLFCFFCALARRSFASSTAALGALPPAPYVTCVASSSHFRQSRCAPCRLAAPFCQTTHLARKHAELQSRQAARPLALLCPGPTRKGDLDAKIGSFWAKGPKSVRGPRAFILGCIRIAQHAIVGACRTSKTHPRHTSATTMRPVSHARSGCLGGSSRTDVRPPAKPGSGLVLNPPQATCRRCTCGYDSKSIHIHAPPSQPCGAIAHAPALAAQALGMAARAGVEGTHLHRTTASKKERTAASRIPTWSPTAVLTRRYHA